MKTALILALFLLALATIECGSDNPSAVTEGQPTADDQQPDSDGPTDNDDAADDQPDRADNNITNALFTNREASCGAYAQMYVSDVMDVQSGVSFAGDLTISLTGGTCVFETNAIPNHNFNDGGSFATPTSAQNDRYEMPATASTAGSVSPLILGDDAIFLNGVKLDLLAAACYDVGNEPLGREKIGCGPDQDDNPWRYDPMSPLNEFGTDRNNAHTQPDGTYHYHGDPRAMFISDCASATAASPVIGFAGDGFPIFGSCIDDGGSLRRATSSYVLKNSGGARQDVSGYTTPVGGRGAVASSNYDGQFRGDYEYAAGSGDLDECNGMIIDGDYGYVVTNTYPWVIGCFKGTPDDSFYRLGPP
jgi:hypothetical protein